jgi:hypothetical protein
MLKKEELFVLIKSMTQSEKRHFALESTLKNTDTSYMEVFKAIEEQEVYDEKALKIEFADRKFVQQFHVIKSYLKQRLLKSLRGFHSNNSIEIELRNLLCNVEILFNKELYQNAEVELKRAEKVAKQIESYIHLFEIQAWKRKLAQTYNPGAFEQFESILKEQEESLAQLKNSHVYDEIIVGISQAVVAGKTELIKNEKLLHTIDNATNFSSGVIHFNAKYFRSIQNNEKEHTQSILKDLDRYFDEHPSKILNDPGLYVSSMNNSIGYFVFNKDYKTALHMIEKVKAFCVKVRLTNENKTLLKQILRLHNIELETYRNLNALDTFKSEIEDIQRLVDANRYKMPKDYLISFWFQFANIEFSQKRYSKSLKWVNEILNTKFDGSREDLQVHTRFLNLMIHFEKQNLFVLRYYLDSTRRFMKKLKIEDSFLDQLLLFISKLGKAPLLEYKGLFKDFYSGIEFEKDEGVNSPRGGYIDYSSWLADHC